jgi:hypothetical protein
MLCALGKYIEKQVLPSGRTHGNPSPVRVNNRLGDGQAQARTIGVQLLARLVCPKEAVEQAGDHLRIDGRSGVDDIHGGSVQVP